MKRTLKYALTAVLGATLIAPAFGQDNFPDVPDNHWAYEALARLKREGILVGYPDGLFRGGRPASRYELAVALHAAYTNLRGITDGLTEQIKTLEGRIGGSTPDTSGLDQLRQALANLQNDVNRMKGWGDDIANLRRMTDTFQRELQSLGVDVEAMKRDLGDLADRVRRLEARRPAVDISGDANLWLGAGNSRAGRFGLDMDGRLNGVSAGGTPTNMTRDLTILHEGAFTLAGTNETGPKWRGTLVVGNMLGANGTPQGFGNQSQPNYGQRYTEGPADVYLQDFSVKFDTSVAGLGFNAEIGRLGYKVSPYIFQRMDKTTYFANDRWDNGLYYFDGAVLGFNFGGAKIDVFGGRTTNRQSVNGTDIDPVVSGPINGPFPLLGGTPQVLPLDRTLGVNFNMPLTTAGNLNLAYLWLDSDSVRVGANRLAVFGANADFALGAIKVEGSYSQSNLQANNRDVNNRNNRAYQFKLGWNGDKWGIFGLYRTVEANFLAPGDWGRLGILRNPTNIEGFQFGGHLNLSGALTLNAMAEIDKGRSNAFAATTGFNTNTRIDKFAIDLGFKVSQNLSLNLGYEDTRFRNLAAIGGVGAPGQPQYRWTTFGLGYGLSDNARFLLQYQLSDVNNEFVLAPRFNRYQGGLLTTQLSVKF